MILHIGEILADIIEDCGGRHAFVGGAPFNVAVNAKRQGAKVGFIGQVGKDEIGAYLLERAQGFGLDYTDITVDEARQTGVAAVSLDANGERSFCFMRQNTADYNFPTTALNWEKYKELNIVHLGTLMLDKPEGVALAHAVIAKVKAENKLLSVDANFREDTFESAEARNKVFTPFLQAADILKLSMDELFSYTGEKQFDSALKALSHKGILFVTDGAKGSYAAHDGSYKFVPTVKVKAVDTTGAGDAFFGAALAQIDLCLSQGVSFDLNRLVEIAQVANQMGAKATQRKGAL